MQGDNKAEEAITEALNDVNTKMIEETRTARGDHSRSERGYPRSRANIRTSIHTTPDHVLSGQTIQAYSFLTMMATCLLPKPDMTQTICISISIN